LGKGRAFPAGRWVDEANGKDESAPKEMTLIAAGLSVESFVLVLCAGSALIAVWIAVRLPDFGPARLQTALLHILLSVLVGAVTTRAVAAVAGLWVPTGQFIAIFAIALPGLTYMFLAAAWLMRVMRDFIQPRI
jgi:hypothetical protein